MAWINARIDDDGKVAAKIRKEQRRGQNVRLFNKRKLAHAPGA